MTFTKHTFQELEEIILNTGMKGPGYQSQTEEIQKTALGMGLTSLNDNAGNGDLIEMCTGLQMSSTFLLC